MITGFHTGVSGLYYNEQKLAVTSNNLANVDTAGFRNSYLMFRTREENELSHNVDYSIRRRLPDIYGIERSGVHKNYNRTGELKQTGNDLDVAIPTELKNAFFAVRRADPNDPNIYYTRNGRLSIGPLDPNNPDGPTALYMAGHIALDAAQQPILVDAAGGPLTIANDGEITQGENAVGQLPLFRLDATNNPTERRSANLQELVQLGDSLFKVPEQRTNQFFPHEIKVGEAGIHRTVLQGMRERSNVNIFSELVELINSTKGADANRIAMTKQMDGLNKLFQIVRR